MSDRLTKASAIAAAARDRNGADVVALDVRALTSFADTFAMPGNHTHWISRSTAAVAMM